VFNNKYDKNGLIYWLSNKNRFCTETFKRLSNVEFKRRNIGRFIWRIQDNASFKQNQMKTTRAHFNYMNLHKYWGKGAESIIYQSSSRFSQLIDPDLREKYTEKLYKLHVFVTKLMNTQLSWTKLQKDIRSTKESFDLIRLTFQYLAMIPTLPHTHINFIGQESIPSYIYCLNPRLAGNTKDKSLKKIQPLFKQITLFKSSPIMQTKVPYLTKHALKHMTFLFFLKIGKEMYSDNVQILFSQQLLNYQIKWETNYDQITNNLLETILTSYISSFTISTNLCTRLHFPFQVQYKVDQYTNVHASKCLGYCLSWVEPYSNKWKRVTLIVFAIFIVPDPIRWHIKHMAAVIIDKSIQYGNDKDILRLSA